MKKCVDIFDLNRAKNIDSERTMYLMHARGSDTEETNILQVWPNLVNAFFFSFFMSYFMPPVSSGLILTSNACLSAEKYVTEM